MLLKRWSSLPPLQRPDAGSESFGSVTNIISQPLTLRSERQEHRNSAACFSTPYTQYIVQCQWKNPALLCLCLCLWECVCVYLCLPHSLQAIQCYMKGSVCFMTCHCRVKYLRCELLQMEAVTPGPLIWRTGRNVGTENSSTTHTNT